MTLAELQKQLQDGNGKKIQLKINDNRSTMLSVRWDPECTRVSLHRLFLEAPKNIMQDLACYVQDEEQAISNQVKAFIEDRIKKFDYSYQLDLKKLETQGHFYNLQQTYDQINAEYFQRNLNLHITWFGNAAQKNKSRMTLGLYYEPLRLIKIHRFLDSPTIPDYLVSFVLYHEMLHCVCPSYYDDEGHHQIHSKEFKTEEARFKHYGLAQKWIAENTEQMFEV
jgi:hypothetical protein